MTWSNGDGFITKELKEEVFQMLNNCMPGLAPGSDRDESIKDIVTLSFTLFSPETPGEISFQDYKRCVKNEPLWLEAFGQCFPESTMIISFLEQLKEL